MIYPHALRSPRPTRVGLLLALSLGLWLASALSFAPTALALRHADVCKCADCKGGPTCCCLVGLQCPTP